MKKLLNSKLLLFISGTASLFTLIPQPAQAANLPGGLAAFTWILNGVTQTIENAINIIQSINPQPVTGLVPPVVITFTESPSQVVLTVQGGDFDVDSTQTFGISGSYWNTSIGISQDSGIFVDKLGLSGNITHKLGPHPDDGLGSPAQFTASWLPPLNPAAAIDNPKVHPTNSHIDNYTASLNGTTSGIGSDIGTWNFTATGIHKIHDVPGPLPILGLGAAFGYSRKLRRLIKSSKP